MDWRAHFGVEPLAACVFIALGVILDLCTLIMQLRKNVRGYGNSGFTVVPSLFGLLMVVISREPVVLHVEPRWVSRLLAGVALVLYASLCQLYIPLWHTRWIERKRSRTPE